MRTQAAEAALWGDAHQRLEAVRRLVDRAALASSRVLEDQGVGRDGVDLDHEIAGLASDAEPHLVRQRPQGQLVARARRGAPLGKGFRLVSPAVTARPTLLIGCPPRARFAGDQTDWRPD